MATPFPRAALAAAGHRFVQAKGDRIQLAEFDEIMLHQLTRTDPDEISGEICETVRSGSADPAYRASAYLALGKKGDPELIEFFRIRLAAELEEGEPGAAYQVMVALEELDEAVFAPGRGDANPNESDLNQRDAEAYLAHLA